jgi:hypothetical protein
MPLDGIWRRQTGKCLQYLGFWRVLSPRSAVVDDYWRKGCPRLTLKQLIFWRFAQFAHATAHAGGADQSV